MAEKKDHKLKEMAEVAAPAEVGSELGQDALENKIKPNSPQQPKPQPKAPKAGSAGGIAKAVIALIIIAGALYVLFGHGGTAAPAASTTIAITQAPTVAVTTSVEPVSTLTTVEPTTTTGEQEALYMRVYENDHEIIPSAFDARVNTRITLDVINNGTIPHDLVVTGFAETYYGTQTLQPGQNQTISFVVNATGRYPYYSDIGPQRVDGLAGNLTVVG